VHVGIDTAGSAVDVDAVYLRLRAISSREQRRRRGDLALCGSHLSVVGKLKGKVAAK
jgi:hypothetical protein